MVSTTGVSASIYATPCSSGTRKQTLSKCDKIYYTGTKSASSCGDNYCWVQVSTPTSGWVANFECSEQVGHVAWRPAS